MFSINDSFEYNIDGTEFFDESNLNDTIVVSGEGFLGKYICSVADCFMTMSLDEPYDFVLLDINGKINMHFTENGFLIRKKKDGTFIIYGKDAVNDMYVFKTWNSKTRKVNEKSYPQKRDIREQSPNIVENDNYYIIYCYNCYEKTIYDHYFSNLDKRPNIIIKIYDKNDNMISFLYYENCSFVSLESDSFVLKEEGIDSFYTGTYDDDGHEISFPSYYTEGYCQYSFEGKLIRNWI